MSFCNDLLTWCLGHFVSNRRMRENASWDVLLSMESDVMLAVREDLHSKKDREVKAFKADKQTERKRISRQTCTIEREREEVDEVELHILGCRLTY